MDSVSALHKTDNFHFAHLLVIVYEADQVIRSQADGSDAPQLDESLPRLASSVNQPQSRVLQVLIDFILSFI